MSAAASLLPNPTPLKTVVDYLQTLDWLEGGLLSRDMINVVNFIDSTPDSRWLVAETKRCIILTHHWQSRVRACMSRLTRQVNQRRDVVDEQVKGELVRAGRTTRMRYVTAGIERDPEFARLLEAETQYELVLGTLEGISAALETQLVVQEAVSVRRQEMIDNLSP